MDSALAEREREQQHAISGTLYGIEHGIHGSESTVQRGGQHTNRAMHAMLHRENLASGPAASGRVWGPTVSRENGYGEQKETVNAVLEVRRGQHTTRPFIFLKPNGIRWDATGGNVALDTRQRGGGGVIQRCTRSAHLARAPFHDFIHSFRAYGVLWTDSMTQLRLLDTVSSIACCFGCLSSRARPLRWGEGYLLFGLVTSYRIRTKLKMGCL